MRKITTILITVIFFITLLSCEEETEIPKTGEPFGRAASMKFYYCNAKGEDLLAPENGGITPINFDFSLDIPKQESFEDSVNYFYNFGSKDYNSELEKYYWETLINGGEGFETHQFYIYLSENDIDTIKVEFRFTTGAYDGGNGIYAYIEKLTYNGIIIRGGEETSNEFTPEHIFIKKDNGKSVITFKK